MTTRAKFLRRLLDGRSDQNTDFASLCQLLKQLGFNERIRGDHHIFGREGVPEILNLQPLPSGKAKAYQVKQARGVLVRHKLTGEDDE